MIDVDFRGSMSAPTEPVEASDLVSALQEAVAYRALLLGALGLLHEARIRIVRLEASARSLMNIQDDNTLDEFSDG